VDETPPKPALWWLTFSIDALNRRREEAIDQIITLLHALVAYLRDYRTFCSFECSSILLGALMKEMKAKRLLSPRPKIAFDGYSVMSVAKFAREIRSPVWSIVGVGYGYHPRAHTCGLASFIEPFIKSVTEYEMKGILLPCCDNHRNRQEGVYGNTRLDAGAAPLGVAP